MHHYYNSLRGLKEISGDGECVHEPRAIFCVKCTAQHSKVLYTIPYARPFHICNPLQYCACRPADFTVIRVYKHIESNNFALSAALPHAFSNKINSLCISRNNSQSYFFRRELVLINCQQNIN